LYRFQNIISYLRKCEWVKFVTYYVGLGRAVINLYTRFDASGFTRSKDRKVAPKFTKRLVWGGYGSFKVTGNAAFR